MTPGAAQSSKGIGLSSARTGATSPRTNSRWKQRIQRTIAFLSDAVSKRLARSHRPGNFGFGLDIRMLSERMRMGDPATYFSPASLLATRYRFTFDVHDRSNVPVSRRTLRTRSDTGGSRPCSGPGHWQVRKLTVTSARPRRNRFREDRSLRSSVVKDSSQSGAGLPVFRRERRPAWDDDGVMLGISSLPFRRAQSVRNVTPSPANQDTCCSRSADVQRGQMGTDANGRIIRPPQITGHKLGTRWARDGHKAKRRPQGRRLPIR